MKNSPHRDITLASQVHLTSVGKSLFQVEAILGDACPSICGGKLDFLRTFSVERVIGIERKLRQVHRSVRIPRSIRLINLALINKFTWRLFLEAGGVYLLAIMEGIKLQRGSINCPPCLASIGNLLILCEVMRTSSGWAADDSVTVSRRISSNQTLPVPLPDPMRKRLMRRKRL